MHRKDDDVKLNGLKSQNNYSWRHKNQVDQLNASSGKGASSHTATAITGSRINVIENVEPMRAFDRLYQGGGAASSVSISFKEEDI
jgi:hypothetical protein